MSAQRPIGAAFARAKERGEVALVAYAMAGDPDAQGSVEVFAALADGGADIIEIGIPFSDPIADGPVIQAAAARSLAAGTTLRKVLEEIVPAVQSRVGSVPLVAMTYYNVVLSLGEERFVALGQSVGLAGAIVPDLPPEESAALRRMMDAAGLDLVPLCAPTTPRVRAEAIARDARGFVYCVSVAGVTGARSELPADLAARLTLLRQASNTPVAVGFGVASVEHARELAPYADGVVVGSAIVTAARERGAAGAKALSARIKQGLRR